MKLAEALRFFRGFGIAGIVSFMMVTVVLYLYLGITFYWPFITYLTVHGNSGAMAITLYMIAFLILLFPIVSLAVGIVVGFLIGSISRMLWKKKR